MGIPVEFLYCAFKLEVTSRSLDGTTKQSCGTGFFVGDVGGSLYLVTNRHVVDVKWDRPGTGENSTRYRDHTLDTIICHGRPNGSDLIKFELLDKTPYFDFDNNHDVSVIPVSRVFGAPAAGGPIKISNYVDFSNFTTTEEFRSGIDLTDLVGFPGYGEAHSASDQRPIMRVGYVVSDPRLPLNYEEVKGEAVLIEGFSTAGASGSPVFVAEKGVPFMDGVAITERPTFRRWSLLGVNAGHMKSSEHLHSQISYVFKSTIIRRIIDGLSAHP
jgi:hypothetical protein